MKIVPAVSSMVGEPQSPPPVHPPVIILKVFRMDPLVGSRRKNLDWFNGQSPKEEVPTSTEPLNTAGESQMKVLGEGPREVCQRMLPVLAFKAEKLALPPPTKTSSWPLTETTVGELATPTRGGLQEESVVCPMKVDQTRAPVLALDACT